MVAPDTGAAVVGAGSGVNATTSLTGGELILTTTSAWGSTTGGIGDAATGSTVSVEKRLGSKEEKFSSFLAVGDTGVSTTGTT